MQQIHVQLKKGPCFMETRTCLNSSFQCMHSNHIICVLNSYLTFMHLGLYSMYIYQPAYIIFYCDHTPYSTFMHTLAWSTFICRNFTNFFESA